MFESMNADDVNVWSLKDAVLVYSIILATQGCSSLYASRYANTYLLGLT